MKKCTKCSILLPRTDFYVNGKHITGKCKTCICEENKQKRLELFTESENVSLGKEGKRRCSKCCEVKTTEFFYKKRESFEGFCKQCKSSKSKVNRDSNPDFLQNAKIVRDKYWEANPEAYQKSLEYHRGYYQENKQKHHQWVRDWFKRHPGKSTEYFRKWRLQNLDVSTYHAQKRRAAKIQATASWAALEECEIKALYKKSRELTQSGVNHNVDHIVPLQSEFVCGLHCLANLQVITASENFAKSNYYWPDMW